MSKMMEENVDLEDIVLQTLYTWGAKGVTRETFYNVIKGLNYDDLNLVLQMLEGLNYVEMEWTGPARFFAYLTPDGVAYFKSRGTIEPDEVEDFEEAILQMLVEAGDEGVTSEQFVEGIDGLTVDDLVTFILAYETEYYVKREWTGDGKFTTYLTNSGREYLESLDEVDE